MFQVTAATLAEYLDFDRARRSDLVSLHALLRKTAPDLRRLTLSAPKRLVLQTLFTVGRATGLDNRLFAVARAGA